MAARPTNRQSRSRFLRVTTGCKTCRRRHVKCDERKPACANCGKRNRICEYDSPAHDDGNNGNVTQTSTLSRSSPMPTPVEAPESPERPTSEVHALANTWDLPDPHDINTTVPDVLPLSACDAASPFSATLESILHQATDINHFQSRSPNILNGIEFRRDSRSIAPTRSHHEEVHMTSSEVIIFRNYTENVSKWVDSFSHDQPFQRLVPILALRCRFLLHSCLALAGKQMVLVHTVGIDEDVAVRYYRLALKAISNVLVNPQHAQSDEVLAACILLSTYEMFNVVGESVGSHLKGIASLLQTRQISGDANGIKGACYWAWYRHEIWASLQNGRCMSLDERYWQPPPVNDFDSLSVEDIANRVIFIFGQCINFCNGSETSVDRQHRAALLNAALDDWKSRLPSSLCLLATGYKVADIQPSFPSIWFLFPQSAVANEVYYASKIILALQKSPDTVAIGGISNLTSLSVRREIEVARKQIMFTANAGIPDAWSLVSAQCLYIAGLVTEGIEERRATLDLINECQQRSGRKTVFIVEQLQLLWDMSRSPLGI